MKLRTHPHWTARVLGVEHCRPPLVFLPTALLLLNLILTGCGGGDSAPAPSPPASTSTYTIGGSVSGLTGSGLALRNNGGNELAIGVNGTFTFSTALTNATTYSVSVATQPSSPAQVCSVTNGSGTVAGLNVLNVQVLCAVATGKIGTLISGLQGTGLELLLNNAELLVVGANGALNFSADLPAGSAYTVTVKKQPILPRQSCSLTNQAGSVAPGTTSTVSVACSLLAGNLRSTIPAPTYALASGERETFNSISSARSGGRFGLLAQSAFLDMAALQHARYLAAHFYGVERFDPTLLSQSSAPGPNAAHRELAGNAHFSGEWPIDRARATGYGWIDGAEVAVFNVGNASRDCSDQILDSAVLRQRVLSTDMRDIGIGIATTADSNGFVCVVLTAYSDFRGEAPGGWVGVYPFDSSTEASVAMASDSTGDVLGLNRGVPILLMTDHDVPLSLSVTIRKIATNALVTTATATANTLPNDVSPNQIVVVPQVLLEPETAYAVRAIGTVDGLPVDQTTRFTTGKRSRSAPFLATQSSGTMRAIYAYPTDRQPNSGYRDAVQSALEHLQGWYQQQLGGETFSIYASAPQVCALPNPSAYYLNDTWGKVQLDLQSCAPVRFSDPFYNWVVYADVIHGCNLPGRLGAGTDTLTMLPRSDLEGLMGRDTGIDDCGVQYPVFNALRFIGGLGHEIGHTLNLPHPPGCEASLPVCDSLSLMWQGVYSYPTGHFSTSERATLKAHRFINVQRFGR